MLPIPSSTNGITEYNSAVLGEEFKGSMCFATFGFDAGGSSFSLKLSSDGKRVEKRDDILPEHGGLDMIMDRYASLVVSEVSIFQRTDENCSDFLSSILETKSRYLDQLQLDPSWTRK